MANLGNTMKRCVCGHDISDRPDGSRYCLDCLARHKKETNAMQHRKCSRHKYHCNRCGKIIGGKCLKYCPECSDVRAVEKNRIRNERYRKRHRKKLRTKATKYRENHREEVRLSSLNYIQQHKELCRDRLRDWREKNPDKWQIQKDRENQRRKEREQHKGTPGYCPQCGRESVKSSQLKLCKYCLFKQSDEKYRKRFYVNLELKQKKLRDKFEHLIPETLHDPWVDEFVDILKMKTKIGIMSEEGETKKWTKTHINNIFNKYYNKDERRDFTDGRRW